MNSTKSIYQGAFFSAAKADKKIFYIFRMFDIIIEYG